MTPAASTTPPPSGRVDLTRYAWLAIAAALATITLKTGAWLLTGSVGLLSDAAESIVNLVAAIVALIALRIAALPPDDNHQFGHAKAEYFSAAVEGVMIFVATEKDTFTPEFAELLQRLADNLAFALESFDRADEKARTEEQKERLRRMFAALSATNEAIMRAKSRSE